jgi:hypothetical protein
MADEMNKSRSTEIPPDIRTPARDMELLRNMLLCCAMNAELYLEGYLKQGLDIKDALKESRKHVNFLMRELIKTLDGQAALDEERTELQAVKNPPSLCYSNYYACLAAGGTNCLAQLQLCLSNPKSAKTKIE